MNELQPAKGWTAIKRHIKDWDKPQLTALLKDLHDHSSANRTFLQARTQADTGGGVAIETYRQRIVEQFFPKRGFGKLKLSEARKAIRDYKKATQNTEGVIELLLTYLENGNEFTRQYGDINGPFYDSLMSVMNELADLIGKEGSQAYDKVSDRLFEVARKCDGMGWGYGDYINESVEALEDLFPLDESNGGEGGN